MSEKMMSQSGVSVIIPFFNEREGIRVCCSALDDYCKSVNFPIELVFVDDGSQDDTAYALERISFEGASRVKLVRLSKNCGSQIAIRAGIREATYQVCTWVGADLQDPLELIGEGYKRITDGYDIVCIEKKSNKVSFSTKLFSTIYSKLICKYAVDKYTSFGIDSVVFSDKVKQILNKNIEVNSEIVLQILDMGFDVTTISMDFNERKYGSSKWTLSKKIKLFIDSFISFSYAPIRLVSLMGIILMILGFVIGVVTIISKLTNGGIPEGYSTIVSLIALGFGTTHISIGIVAEYLWRTFDIARNRPSYLIKEKKILKAID